MSRTAPDFYDRDGTFLRSVSSAAQFLQLVQVLKAERKYNSFGCLRGGGSSCYTVFVYKKHLRIVNPFWGRYFSMPFGQMPPAQPASRTKTPQSGSRFRVTPIDGLMLRSPSRSTRQSTKEVVTSRSKAVYASRQPSRTVNDQSSGSASIFISSTGQTVTNQSPHTIRYFVIEKTSVSTPGFKTIKKADRPWHSHTLNRYSIKESEGAFESGKPPGNYTNSYGYFRGTYGQLPSWYWANARVPKDLKTANPSLIKCLRNAKDMSVNLAQLYAERRQTSDLIFKSLNRMVTLAIALRKGDFKRAKTLADRFHQTRKTSVLNVDGTAVISKRWSRTAKQRPKGLLTADNFANAWLEFSYGWKPLLSDIYGSCEYLANTFFKRKSYQASGKSVAEEPFSQQSATALKESALFAEMFTGVDKSVSRTVLQFREDDALSRILSQTGISDPLLLAWELLPYSFVIDWFIPVGNYLESLNAIEGLSFVRGATTTKATRVGTSAWQVLKGNSFGTTLTGSTIELKSENKSRTVFTTIPTPSFPVPNPRLGVERSLSAISLITQIIKGHSPVR